MRIPCFLGAPVGAGGKSCQGVQFRARTHQCCVFGYFRNPPGAPGDGRCTWWESPRPTAGVTPEHPAPSPGAMEVLVNDTTPIYGQGDVTLVYLRPYTGTLETAPMTVVGRGSSSAHEHVVEGVLEGDTLSIPTSSTLRVQGQTWRHDPIEIPAGVYQVLLQTTYTPEGDALVED